MKNNTVLSLLIIASLSPAAFAAKTVSCELKLSKNDVHCGLRYIVGCPEKELKKSKTSFSLEIEDGETLSGQIKLKKVILNPDSDKHKKSDVILFADDSRDSKLSSEDKVNLTSFELSKSISYKVQHNSLGLKYTMPERQGFSNAGLIYEYTNNYEFSGDTIIELNGNNGSWGVIALSNNGEASIFSPLIQDRVVEVKCSTSDETSVEVNQDKLREEEAIQEFRKEHAKASKQ